MCTHAAWKLEQSCDDDSVMRGPAGHVGGEKSSERERPCRLAACSWGWRQARAGLSDLGLGADFGGLLVLQKGLKRATVGPKGKRANGI